MTRHGRCKKKGRTAALLALLFAFVLPASAFAWDSPLEPVTPATDSTQEHGLGLDTSTIPMRFSTSAIEDVVVDAADLPASVDLTPWAMPSGNQGAVGACAAWATDYSVLGYWMNKQGIAGGALAPMFTYSQYSATYSGGQDRGSSLDYHAQVAKTGGIDALSDYPQGNFDFHTLPTAQQKANAVQWKVSSWQYLPTQQSATATVTQDSIKTALANGDPVVLGMPVYTSFDAVRATNHGYYNPTTIGTFRGNHAVTALGYDSTGVRIQNQWDTWWGENGFATLSWAFVNKYVFGAMEVGPMVDPDPMPKLVADPLITGQLGRGQTLTATAGKYTAGPTGFDYQWQRGDGTTFSNISGATSSTYVTTQDDVTKKVRVVVKASNADGSVTGTSNVLGPIVPVIPASTEAPVLSGDAKRGEALSVTKGVWTDNPTAWTYVWQRSATGTSWTAISGATTTSYTLAVADLNQKIRVSVTAKNAVGTGTAAVSNVLGPIAANAPVNSDAPDVSGTAARGVVLTATPGTWAGAGNTYKYQWQRKTTGDWAAITGATAASYTVVAADLGAKLRVSVTATNSDGSATANSTETAEATKSLPVAEEIPAPTGAPARGNALTAKSGTWQGVGNTYKYQWQRKTTGDWANITGAIAVTYTLTAADTGALIRVQVTGTNVDGSAAGFSDEAGPVAAAPPVNNTVPVVTGTAARASTLSSNTGSWSGPGNVYSYQWQAKADGDWEDITGATKATYVVQKSDEAALLRVEVTATNVDAAVPAVSAATAAVAAAPPVNVGVPLLTGTVARTKPLTATPGTWTGPGNTFAYQWQRDSGSGFADITGATTNVYTLAQDDVGAKVRVKVTATNPDGPASAYSAATVEVGKALPVQSSAPVVTGTAKTGLTLTSSSGVWTPAGATYAYQWQSSSDGTTWADIDGATANTYVLTDDEAGLKVRTKVTATNADGSTAGTSAPFGPVLSTPVNSAVPEITGTLTDAAVLTASNGTWASAGGLTHTYKYQWVRCAASATTAATCATITGATSQTYTTVAADVASKLAVRVTATNSQNVPAVAASALTAALEGRALTNVTAPEITGTAGVKEKLTASVGTWSVPTTKATYQWLRCDADGANCVAITAATASTYIATATDVDKTLKVRVNVTSPGRTAEATSEATDPVAPLPTPSTDTPVAITGTPARAQTLKASMPAWEGFPTAYAYQWLRCDADGDNCAAITGAKGNSYLLVKADEGATIRIKMTATNTTGTGESTSDQTTAVADVKPANTVAPTVAGTAMSGQTLSGARGTWATTTDTTYALAWQRCGADGTGCAPIAAATAATYKLTGDDVGKTVKLSVTATNPDGSATAASAATAAVKAAPPAASPLPTLTGIAQVGKVLTSTTGTWTGTSEVVKTQFWRCTTTCAAIGSASTDRTYTVVAADAGTKLKVSVTGVGPGGTVTLYAATILGPVQSATSGALLAAAAPLALKSATGTVLAKVAAKTPAAGGTAKVTVTPSKSLKSGYKAWACPTATGGNDVQPCTKPVKLGAKATTLKVPVDAGEKVSVVVAKTK